MPTVSVVIPAYNAEQYILETIRSVQNQTFSAFEILVVDDGSTDQTLALLETLNEPRLRVITGQHKGVSAARNCGIAAAQGEFIAFLDADDLWTPDKLQDQVEALQRSPAAGLAYSWTYYWMYAVEKASRTTSLVRSQVSGTDAYRTFLQENVVTSGSNITVRRAAVAAVGGFDESLTHGEDWEFCCRIARTWEVIL
ncbi:MAG TPA: glycosyltransferase family 2 protein, partial [Stenomitos sp.]